MNKPKRCGSYPFMNIAEDFGLPYGVVVSYAEALDKATMQCRWAVDYIHNYIHSYYDKLDIYSRTITAIDNFKRQQNAIRN